MNNTTLTYAWQRGRFKALLLWFFLVILSVSGLAAYQHNHYMAELNSESAGLFRIASQRASQHGAHLTALAVVTDSGISQYQDIFLNMAKTISHFYPRINEIQLIQLVEGQQLIGTKPLEANVASTISMATRKATGMFTLVPHPSRKEHYLLIKRRPNSDEALYALTLSIDAKKLLSSKSPFWSRDNVVLQLALPNGAVVIGAEEIETPQYSEILSSYTQPLRLSTSIRLGFADLLPALKVIGTILLVSLLYFLALLVVWQKERTRAAEQLAKLREIETQLSHASRVNAMGEMASGMAHELTQPLTAILAQSQAGLRLLEPDNIEELKHILHDTVLQSRRASSILERLRNWSRPHREEASATDLLDALYNVRGLFTSEADQQGVQLEFHLPQQEVVVLANQVEMEQVIYNLVRNGFDALKGTKGARIDVSLDVSAELVILEVSDNGQGVPADIIPQLFTPFYTTRDNGTGLGLTLSQRLVERANGEISYVEGGLGATFRVVLPLAVDHCTLRQSEIAQ